MIIESSSSYTMCAESESGYVVLDSPWEDMYIQLRYEQVQQLVPALQRWLDTGELESTSEPMLDKAPELYKRVVQCLNEHGQVVGTDVWVLLRDLEEYLNEQI